jgi:hypothetical protein
MAVPYKQNAPLLQFLHHYREHTLELSVKFQTGPSILHTLLHPERQTQHFFLRHQNQLWQNYIKSAISVHQLALFQYVDVSCGPKSTKSNNMESERDPVDHYVCFPRPVHRPIMWLSSHARTHSQQSLLVVVLYIARFAVHHFSQTRKSG